MCQHPKAERLCTCPKSRPVLTFNKFDVLWNAAQNQSLSHNYIQESSDFSHSCPTLMFSEHNNRSLLFQDCVILYSSPFPFILLTVCFLSTVALYISILLYHSFLTLFLLICCNHEQYYRKHCQSAILKGLYTTTWPKYKYANTNGSWSFHWLLSFP